MEHTTKIWINIISTILAGIVSFLDVTTTYLIALLIGFGLNILAGFRADEVKIKLNRLFKFPPFITKNFNTNKFVFALTELFLIISITYILKLIVDLNDYHETSPIMVKVFFAFALYFYMRNTLKNLIEVYPKIPFLKFIYYFIAFKFRELVGKDVSNAIDKSEVKEEMK